MRRFAVILPVVIIIVGCGGRREMAEHLADIASYINDRPDSALVELRAIDMNALHSRKYKAQHSLLHAMALDKCYIDMTSDSIIAPAVRYYRHHGTFDDKMKALQYEGKVYQYRGEYNRAAILFSQAEDWASKAKDKHAIALLYLSFSEVYRKVNNLDKQQKYCEKALEVLAGTGDPLYERALGQLAVPYMYRREWATADSLFRRSLESSEGYPAMIKYIINNYGRMKMLQDKPDPAGAIALFKRKMEEFGSLTVEEAGAYAYACARIGDDATADKLIEQFKGYNEKNWRAVLPWMYRISAFREDYPSAYKYLNEAHRMEESTIQNTLTDSITNELKEYQTLTLERERSRRRTISLLSALLLLSATVIVLLATVRKRDLQHEMDSLLAIQESLRMENEFLKTDMAQVTVQSRSAGNKTNNKLKCLQVQMQKERIESFRQRKVFDYVLWMNENHIISDANALKELKDEIMSFYKIERNQEELEKELDTSLDGLITDLKRDLGISKPKDIHFLCLWLLDTKTAVVSEILGMNDNTVYIKRSRLRNSIKNLGDKYGFLFN